jgi:hypothetical protein
MLEVKLSGLQISGDRVVGGQTGRVYLSGPEFAGYIHAVVKPFWGSTSAIIEAPSQRIISTGLESRVA